MSPFRSPAASLPYGRACQSCARIKCKCVARSDGPGCERCHRLNRSCQPGNATRLLNAQRNNPVARIAQLEGKIESLLSIMESGHVVTSRIPDHYNVLSFVSSNPVLAPSAGPLMAISSASTSLTSGLSSEEEAEKEQYLNYFRSDMLKYFAIVDLSDDLQWLRRKRPFLYLCIMAVATPSTQTKLALGQRFKQILAQRIVLDNDPETMNIDLLLGLLTFLAWGHDHLLHGNSASLSRFTQLAMTLVFHLRLNKPPPEDSNMLPVGDPVGGRVVVRTMEERRTVLGCSVINTIVSSYFAQIDAMQWTPYMEECLEILSQKQESPYDEVFTHQVRLQRTAGDLENARGTMSVPSAFYLAAFRLKVNEVRARISSQLQQDRIVLASVHYTELSVYSLVISKEDDPGFQRLEYLHSCLTIVRSALENFFQIPPAEYAGIPFPLFTYLARYIMVLFKLSTLNEPGWDIVLVRSAMDVTQVMDQIISNIQLAKVAEDEKSAGGFLDKACKIFASVRARCVAKLADDAGRTSSGRDAAGNGDLMPEPLALEDLWLKDNFADTFLGEGDLILG